MTEHPSETFELPCSVTEARAESLRATPRSESAAGPPEREALFGLVFEASSQPCLILDLNGRIITANPAACALFGHAAAALRERRWGDLIMPGERFDWAAIERDLTEGRRHQVEIRHVRANGAAFLAEARFGRLECDPTAMVLAEVRDITAQRAVEDNLRDSQEWYRRMLSAVSNYHYTVWVTDGQARSTEHGVGCTIVTGYRPQDYAADDKLWWSMIHPEDRARVIDHVNRVLHGEMVEPIEHRIFHRDGTLRWVRDTIVPEFDAHGRLIRYDGIIQDISERKEAEEAVRRQRDFAESLLNTAPLMVLVLDLDGRILRMNHYLENVTGYRGEEVQGSDWCGLLMPETSTAEAHAELRRAIAGESWVDRVLPVLTRAGEKRLVEWSCRAIPDDQGRPIALLAIGRDITDRRRAEEEVERQRRQLLSIFDSFDTPVYVSDPNTYELLYVNEAFRLRWGEAVGQQCFRVLQNLDQPCPFCTNHLIFGDHLGQPVIWEFQNKVTGQHFRCIDKAIAWPDGRMVRCEVAIDISDRIAVEEQLQRAKAEAESFNHELETLNHQLERAVAHAQELAAEAKAATRAKSEFLANMSHEIRTPMTAILGFTETLLDPDLSTEEKLAAVATIQRNGEHLLGLINDILDLSKIESGNLKVDLASCSPSQIVDEVVSLMRVRAEAKGLQLSVEQDGPLPERITTDPTRLRQVLINLVGNAIKFTDRGFVRLVVRFVAPSLSPPATKPLMQFEVIDSGIGMSEQQLGRLFQPFTQADASTARRYGGTGLGLTISRRLATMLGGNIEVASAVGQGSTFRVTIAAGDLQGVSLREPQESGSRERPPTSAENPADASGMQLSAHVLLAEDSPDNQRLIVHFLRKAGVTVTVVENGKAALDAVTPWLATGPRPREAPPFDAILMDMQMPVLDGYAATRLLRRKGWSRPIIALTANAMSGDEDKCLAAGCDGYLSKPIDRRRLLAVLSQHLRRTSTGDPAQLNSA